jgi:undecaprenyl phosphate N,N'-diacetylbacillosamine 1-phosphate transferase
MRGKEYLNSRLKRDFDMTFAPVLLLALSPLFLQMYLYNSSRNQPLMFHQDRIGKSRSIFPMHKFETMYSGAEKEPEHLIQLHKETRERNINDPRVQGYFLRFMRNSSLNELPQLINIFKGEMSFVGPRPLPEEYVTEAEKLFPDLMKKWDETALTITPGLLGVAPLKTRNIPIQRFDVAAYEEINYFYNASFIGDILVIFQALKAIKP